MHLTGHRFSKHTTVEIKISSKGWLASDYMKVASEVGDRFIHEVRQIEDQLDRLTASTAISSPAVPTSYSDLTVTRILEQDSSSSRYAYVFEACQMLPRSYQKKTDSPYYGKPKVAFYDEQRGYGRLLGEYYATEKAVQREKAQARSTLGLLT